MVISFAVTSVAIFFSFSNERHLEKNERKERKKLEDNLFAKCPDRRDWFFAGMALCGISIKLFLSSLCSPISVSSSSQSIASEQNGLREKEKHRQRGRKRKTDRKSYRVKGCKR